MSQKTNTEALGTESIGRLLSRFALPAIIAMTSSSLYNIIDSIFIGHGVGALAISGLALTMPLMNLSAAFGSMVGVGAASLTSIRLGQGNKERTFLILSNAVMLNITIGVIFTVLGLVFLDPILYFFGASEQTIPYARSFMRIILSGNLITHVYLGLNEILRVSGYPKKAMGIMLTAVAVNCTLNPLFIFVFKWGIAGSATATVIAQSVALMLELLHFCNKKSFIHFRLGTFRFVGMIVRKVLSIGLAPFLLQLCASVVVVFINKALKHNGGDIYIGAYGIVNRVLLLFTMIVAGLNQGMQPIVGYNFGARQFDRVLKALRLTIVLGMCVTTTGFLVGHFLPELVAKLFTDDETLIAVAAQGLRITVMVFPLVGFQIVSANFFQYIGKPQKAISLSMTRQLLFLVPLLAILPNRYGSEGVWMSMPVADFLSTLLTGVLLFFQVRMMIYYPDRVKII